MLFTKESFLLERVEHDVECLETENFVLTHTLDEAFSSLITLKSQMNHIFPFWCEKCDMDLEEETALNMHKKKHRREKKTKTKT